MKQKDTGAPAALARLETQELAAYGEVESCKARIEALRAQQEPVGDDAIRLHRTSIANAESDLLAAYDRWSKISKILLSFDKSVAPSAREGEKVAVADVKEIFAQYELSLSLALESFIITISQQAALCDSPESFHLAYADAIRATRASAVDAAKREGVLPQWLT